jgi:hypothetical protein
VSEVDLARAFRLHSHCRSCDASVIWVKTEKGKWMPLDAEPVDPFDPVTFVLREDVALAVPSGVFEDEPHYVSHFATCPDAESWRNRQKEAKQ